VWLPRPSLQEWEKSMMFTFSYSAVTLRHQIWKYSKFTLQAIRKREDFKRDGRYEEKIRSKEQ
jgi:hypothetical protein